MSGRGFASPGQATPSLDRVGGVSMSERVWCQVIHADRAATSPDNGGDQGWPWRWQSSSPYPTASDRTASSNQT